MLRISAHLSRGSSGKDGRSEPPDPALAVELYRQACEDARAYMDLRFKHFGTFVLVTFGIASAGLKSPQMSDYGLEVCGLGVIVTSLFWALDTRTGRFLRHFAALARARACALGQSSTDAPPGGRFLKAGRVTNLLFATVLTGWVVAFGHVAGEAVKTDSHAQRSGQAATTSQSPAPRLP